MTSSDHRSPARGNAAPRPASGDPAALADEVTRTAVGLPLDYGNTLSDITALLVGDPRNTSHIAAIAEAIITAALADPFSKRRPTGGARWYRPGHGLVQ